MKQINAINGCNVRRQPRQNPLLQFQLHVSELDVAAHSGDSNRLMVHPLLQFQLLGGIAVVLLSSLDSCSASVDGSSRWQFTVGFGLDNTSDLDHLVVTMF